MTHGGLWIGAQQDCDTCADGSRTAVSFGGEDENAGTSAPLTEFTPIPNTPSTTFVRRSTLTNSPYYSQLAVSEEDLIAQYRDTPGTSVGSEPHVPLGLNVTEALYSWSMGPAQDFVIQHFEIRNAGPVLHNVFLTHYTELLSLNKSLYPSYPAPLTPAPYSKKILDWFPEKRLITEHYCDSPGDCHSAKVPVYVGIMLLGAGSRQIATRPDTAGLRWHLLTHDYGGTALDAGTPYARSNDAEKYSFMQRPSPDTDELESQVAGTTDPSIWLTAGPIRSLPTDSVIVLDFAWVGGMTADGIQTSAANASAWYAAHYDLRNPVAISDLEARSEGSAIRLRWGAHLGAPTIFRVQRAEAADHGFVDISGDLPSAPGKFLYEWVDRSSSVNGSRFYRISYLESGRWAHSGAIPAGKTSPGMGIREVVPNPARGIQAIEFQVPRTSEAVLGVYGLDGRRVRTIASGVQLAGSHTLDWDLRGEDGRHLAAGTYLLRLEQSGWISTRKTVILP
jgi:hypothetical protein